ncbi:ATP-binding protein [Kitasatospora sp. NPDC001660]
MKECQVLVGREPELEELTGLLDAARGNRSGAVVLRGSAGIGKSALLGRLAREAQPDVRVLTATGVECEVELPFAALHQLLRPLLPLLHRLPQPQAAALSGAFGMGPGPVDRFVVALAAQTLFSVASEETPLLLLVDDAHWLDAASTDVLTFVARRLDVEAIAMVLAVREGSRPFTAPGVPDRAVGPLGPEAAARLLDRTLPSTAAVTRERLLREADGNPLALVELPAALSPEQRDGSAPLPEHLPLNERLQQVFRYRAASIADQGTGVLLLAAAESGGDISTVLGATPDPQAAMDVLSAAESAGLVFLDHRQLRFRHPLVRSAIYQGASHSQRRAAHLALARTLGVGDDRRIWHLAAATVGTDDTVARNLAEMAERIRRTGAVATAAQALQRAAALTTGRDTRARWLVDAAECAWTAANTSLAEALLDDAEAMTDDAVLRGHCAKVRGAIIHASSDPAEALRVFLDGAQVAAAVDAELTEEILVMAARSAWVAGLPGKLTEIGGLVTALSRDRLSKGAEFGRHFTYLGSLGSDADRPVRARDRNLSGALMTWLSPERLKPWMWPPVFLPYLTGDVEPMIGAYHQAVSALRKVGAAGALPMALAPLVALELVTGQWTSGIAHAEEALLIATETGQLGAACHLRTMLAWMAAARGDGERCRHLAELSLSDAAPRRIYSAVALAHWGLGLNALAERQPERAARLLGEVVRPGGPAEHFMVSWLVLPDLVEALVRSGDPGRARGVLRIFEERAAPEQLPHLHAPWIRCRALVASAEEAPGLYEEALVAPGCSPFDIGRTHLLYGERLRRSRRIKSAREHLHQAASRFEMLDARPWADLAYAELRAAGDRSRAGLAPEPAPAIAQLTPREHQIVVLAAQGMSNGEIAAQLFLSRRTVGYHLHKTFPKLGISSRTQLYGMNLC